MTYCAERTKLLASAGRELAEHLLPKPFSLWYSDHDTGIQMTIVMPQERGQELPVWKGSIWHSSIYEFNDRGAHPGLQPDFEFARDAIEGYFAKIQTKVDERRESYEAAKIKSEELREAQKQSALTRARAALDEQRAGR